MGTGVTSSFVAFTPDIEGKTQIIRKPKLSRLLEFTSLEVVHNCTSCKKKGGLTVTPSSNNLDAGFYFFFYILSAFNMTGRIKLGLIS